MEEATIFLARADSAVIAIAPEGSHRGIITSCPARQ